MKTIKQLERLKHIHQYIKNGNTGTPSEFACKLNISESQLYNILEHLKISGLPIIYSRRTKTYMYSENCDLEVTYSIQLITEKEKIDITGGFVKNNLYSNAIRVKNSFFDL